MTEDKKYKRPNFHPSQLNAWGRPREYDRVKIAQEMLEWSELDTSLNLCEFCADQRVTPSLMFDWVESDPDFSCAYEQVKTRIGDRREKKLSDQTLHVKAYDLNATTYDPFLKRSKRKDLEFEKTLASKQTSEEFEKKIAEEQAKNFELQKRILDLESQLQSQAN